MSEAKQSDWLCIELLGGRRIFTKLPFDPFVEGALAQNQGYVEVKEMFYLTKQMGPDGQLRAGIMCPAEDPLEKSLPPYLINLDAVTMYSKLSHDSPLYKEFVKATSDIELPNSGLIVPG